METLTSRFYFWTENKSYGWRQLGRTDGYATRAELIEDNTWNIEETKREGSTELRYRILEAKADF